MDPMKPFSALVIGGSAGSIEPLKGILQKLPASKDFVIICVLHLLNRQKSLLPEVLGNGCPWPVKDAESTEPALKGHVYFAPPDYHLSLEQDRTFSLSNEEAVMFSRPSIDILFRSAASVYKSELAALILSGANGDGTEGLLRIIRHGGQAMAQNLETAEFSEMPKTALSASPLVKPVSPEEVVEFLNRRF
jgi:two-component system, chemotaxis family, protein-glutamate methylesterase/glutaminase